MGLIAGDVKNESFDSDRENKPTTEGELTIDSFIVEYSKSTRSKCTKCDKRISKSAIRLQIQKTDKWYHLECFVECKDELGFTFDAEK